MVAICKFEKVNTRTSQYLLALSDILCHLALFIFTLSLVLVRNPDQFGLIPFELFTKHHHSASEETFIQGIQLFTAKDIDQTFNRVVMIIKI